MSNFINQLIQEHGHEIISQLTSKVGINEQQAQGAIESIAPMVLGGLKKTKETAGPNAVTNLMSQFGGSEDLLANISSALTQNSGEQNPLSALLGAASSSEQDATTALGTRLNVAPDKANQIFSMLAPVVMGFLSKQGRTDSATPDRTSGILSILDQDGDGNAIDDIAGMILGNKGGAAGNIVGNILGGLFGGKK